MIKLKLRLRVNQLLKMIKIPFRFTARRWRIFSITFLVSLGIFSYLTNPFVRFSIVTDPYQLVTLENGQLQLVEDKAIIVKDEAFFRNLALLKSWWHLLIGKISGGNKLAKTSVDEIIKEIHERRFDPEMPYLISSDHFSVLYPRSLGIFYHSLLDPRTALSETDWQNRQLIYLKTLAYLLQVYSKSDRLSTTVVPVGPRSVALINIWQPPADTLYSLLYGLKVSQSEAFLTEIYPFEASELRQLQINDEAGVLQAKYLESLKIHFEKYQELVFDFETGLVKKNIHLSSTKDTALRQSSFYDNVIYYQTWQLAQDLQIVAADQAGLKALKQRILTTFWDEAEGIFIEDLSQQSLEQRLYSSDWLIVYMTGFLSPANPAELKYFVKNVDYIQRNALDQPFALQYHPDKRPWQTQMMIRLMVPQYGSTTIWSNWGMEYTKLLAHLAQITGDEEYLEEAERQIQAYSYNIKRYRGYPEVYDESGDFYRTFFYQSLRSPGWVVSFEQARALTLWTRSQVE